MWGNTILGTMYAALYCQCLHISLSDDPSIAKNICFFYKKNVYKKHEAEYTHKLRTFKKHREADFQILT